MATRAAQYFAGTFDVGAEPDWERVANSVDLLAANDVRIECLSAVAGEGGKMRVPFFARSGRLREHLDGSADPRGLIEAPSLTHTRDLTPRPQVPSLSRRW